MKKNFLLTLVLLLVALFTVQPTVAQAPDATPAEAITALLNRIGGSGAADKFEIVIDASLAEDGKDVFVITAQNGKPCIKGNTQLSVATGINWYLNHVAHINLTWNNLTTDLVTVELPLPVGEDKHVSSAKYRYDFNTCTFSYSMAFWTWERWQKEIDWMALHGINAPLNLVGLDVVTRKFLRELGVSENDINAYIAGPGFIAWFAMNNLEGWGGTINSPTTGVDMSGNPDWWYTRQEQLCRNMLQRMRELGMQPVIPGFSGQVPNCIVNYSINGFSSGDVVNNGTWAGGYTRPDILKPNTESYRTFAAVYYKHLHEVMGVSELYSIDPFHEGSLPGGVTNETCYPNIMVELDKHFGNVEQSVKDTYKVTKSPSWIIQYWQGVPQSGAFTAMKNAGYASRFIGLDLFADNIYADNAAKWRTNYYDTCPYIYCMLHNFGGRSGLHGRLETTMNGYFQALAKNNNCQGIGATPEGTETNPILYDMLFELPWMSSNPGADAWLAEYAHSRYGVDSKTAPAALEALKNLKKSVWDCRVNQQGTSEAVILARPNWTIGSVSSWSTSAIYWDTQDVLLAADQLYSVKDLVTANGGQDGIANYNYDFIDVVRQAMVDYAAQLLPLINAARGNDAEYTRLYQLYLQLMLDLDTMLSYDENFKLERWTSLARNIAGEVSGTTVNDRNWLEWNARTQVTVWSKGNTDLHDYSNRCWAGLIKDFHYWRWKYFFENNGNAPSGGWFSGFEYPWTVDFNEVYSYAGDYSQIVIPTDMTATEKAAQTFGNYFGRVKGATKNYIFPMGVATNATKSDVIPEVYRGKEVELPLIIGKEVTISSVWVDLNNDGNAGNGETLTANGNNVTIPADAAIGKTTARVTYSDGTVITFNLALIEDITVARTVTAVAGANGSVAIEGTNELSITTTEAVKITATANTGYNFENWTKNGEVVSNDNPFIYYGKEAATFTANFIQDKWGVVADNSYTNELATINQYKSYVHNMTFAYYNREAETIYEATAAPASVFTTIPQIINVPQGASFDIYYDDGDGTGLQYCYFRAYIDLNADGDFDDDGELLKEVGTQGAENTAVCSNKINVLLPYDAPLGITHMRLRFDGAYSNSEKPADLGAKDGSNRPVYEIVLNITDKTDKAAHITVKTNSADWGTVEVWTDETPDGSTGTEWVVSANIPMYLRATKASEDTEFLGWYDHYGRLVTENLEHTMYAREDATYTAKFRKFLEIDGWQIEYRTEPGSMVTNKLASGVKPENGKTYYIYAPTRPTNDGDYVNRYLYNNSGTLSLNTAAGDDSYLWTCSVDGENYTFQNVGDPTKYLAHKATADSPYNFTLGTGATQYEGITIYSVADSRFLVVNDDGSGFNQSTRAHNQSTEDHTTDFVFVEVSYPDNVILTKVRQSGNHDLVIPETVNILGEDLKIIGFDNGLFANNKDLWTITLPSTIETMSSNRVFSTSLKGSNTPINNSDESPTNNTQVIYLDGLVLKNSEPWKIEIKYKSDGVSSFNQWGSFLLMHDTSELLYLTTAKQDARGWHLRSPASGLGDNYFKEHTIGKVSEFTVLLENKGTGKAVIAVTNSEGAIQTSDEFSFSKDNISQFTAKIPTGLDIINFEVFKGNLPDPFEGCTNLIDITVTTGCDYYVADRKFYSPDGTMLHTLADKEKEDEIRALGELIDLADALIEEVTVSVDPTGKATEIALSATQGENYYIWCNNPHGDDTGKVSNMLDEDANTFFHSNWSSISSIHDYLQIDFGTAAGLDNFKIAGQQRHNATDDRPKFIEVYGSNDNTNWTPITTVEDLPNSNSSTWESGAITADTRYAHLKFVVKTYNNYNQSTVTRPYLHMAKFDLLKLTSSAEVAPKYKNLAGVTNDEAAAVYDSMTEALYFYNNGGTAAELQAAYDALKPLYDALNAKKDKIFEGVYNINFNGVPVFVAYLQGVEDLAGANNGAYRLFDGALAHNGAPDGNTDEGHKALHQSAIDAKVAADELFMIVPNSELSGYTLSAQGLYLENTYNGWWGASAFNTDKEQAGVYLFEETEADIYRLKCNERNSLHYVNDWGYVFGNNDLNETYSTFTITPVTEYTVAVPENGTTLCLPFNVVLPAGVTAYDIATDNITTEGGYKIYSLNSVAVENETLLKGTPVILKATVAGNYTFTITMDSENAKGATDGSVLRSGMVKTTIGTAELNYTFANNVFNKVTANTEIAANQCWMELDEDAGAQILDEAPVGPFEYTTDESNPVLYNILINRDDEQGNDKVLQFDEESKKVAVKEKVENNSYQAWYFMNGTKGFRMIPYNGMGKVLSAESSNAEKETVSAQTIGDQTYYEWILTEPDNNGYYYIQVHDGGNTYFSNNGGVDFMMGFWTAKDEGSQFKFVPATFSNDNPRYYQLKDVTAAMDVTKQAMSGDAPGCRENGDEHYNSYTAAMEQINKGSDVAAAADCYTVYTTLRATREALGDMIMPTPGNVYRLKNHISKSAEEGHKNHYIANSNAKLSFPTEADDNTTLWICVEGADGKFQFISGVGSATLTWKNFGENAVDYEIRSGVEQGAVALAYGTDNLTLTNEENANGVLFGHIANNATEQDNTWSTDWYIEPVADDVKAFHSRSIAKGYNYATLYLPYAATVPDGISAYTATVSNVAEEATRRYVDLQEVENGIIPARTAVVLYREGEAPSLQEYKFGYTTDEGTAAVNNIFDGRVMTSAVGGDKENYCYYLLFRGTKGEAFYWMLEEYNESLGSGNTHIKCEGNKAYMVLPKQQNNASSYSFRFPGTTGVEELEGENVEVEGVYDLQGRKVENPGKGLYIINGKKSFIK